MSANVVRFILSFDFKYACSLYFFARTLQVRPHSSTLARTLISVSYKHLNAVELIGSYILWMNNPCFNTQSVLPSRYVPAKIPLQTLNVAI